MVRPSERCLRPRRSAALPCRHRRDATISVVGDGRLTLAVDGVAGTTAECIVIARQVEVILPLVGTMTIKVVGVEVRHDTFGRGFGQVADAVVGHRDCRGRVGVGCRDELPSIVVRVVGDDAAGPGAAGKFAVRGIGVRRPLAVGVEFIRHTTRGFVVEPTGRVAVSERLISVGGHRVLFAPISLIGTNT